MLCHLGKVCLGLLVLAALGSLQAGGPPKFTMTDADILKITSTGPRVPTGFFSEDLAPKGKESANDRASVSWVRQLKKDQRRVVYMWANSLDEAMKLTQAVLDQSSVPADGKKIVAAETTKGYYQFKTKHRVGDSTTWTYYRVWRGDFFQPSDDLGSRYLDQTGTYRIGKLTGKRDEETVRWLAEFLWWVENHNMKSAFVLSPPHSGDSQLSLTVDFYTANVVYGDFGVTDEAHVVHWVLIVNRGSGQVSQTIEGVRNVKGKKAAG